MLENPGKSLIITAHEYYTDSHSKHNIAKNDHVACKKLFGKNLTELDKKTTSLKENQLKTELYSAKTNVSNGTIMTDIKNYTTKNQPRTNGVSSHHNPEIKQILSPKGIDQDANLANSTINIKYMPKRPQLTAHEAKHIAQTVEKVLSALHSRLLIVPHLPRRAANQYYAHIICT